MLNNPSKVKWTLEKFDNLFRAKANGQYLYIVEYFLQNFQFQNNHFSNGPWLAGGTLRRLREGQIFLGADLDIFFKDEFQKNEFISELKQREAVQTFESEFASTYTLLLGDHSLTVQAIHRKYYNMPSDVIADFDITACQMITNGVQVVVASKTLDHIDKKVLRINPNVLDAKDYSAIHTLRRFIKMGGDGYRMGAWHVKEFLEHIKQHPECINEIVSMSPRAVDPFTIDDDIPF